MRSLLLSCLLLCGCIAWQDPQNPTRLEDDGYMAERRPQNGETQYTRRDADAWNLARCTTPPQRVPTGGPLSAGGASLLSPGDMLRIRLPNDEPPSGNYEVDTDGTIALEGLGRLAVRGMTPQQAEAALNRRLVAAGWFRMGHARAILSMTERGPLRIVVAGAVFQPGRIIINQRSAQETDTARQQAIGTHALGGTLSTALAFAGGVRPDADIAHVLLQRDGRETVVDLTGMVSGDPVNDVMLLDGDRVSVPSRRCFQAQLARPTPITPPGVRVFLSNLSTPAMNNAGAAIGRDAQNFPYGIRFLQALASMNCLGGSQMTNADRWAVLISVNPLDGQTEVIERQVERLVRQSDRDFFNPVIMPNDALACYDSRVTNGRELVRTLTDAALSAGVLRALSN